MIPANVCLFKKSFLRSFCGIAHAPGKFFHSTYRFLLSDTDLSSNKYYRGLIVIFGEEMGIAIEKQ